MAGSGLVLALASMAAASNAIGPLTVPQPSDVADLPRAEIVLFLRSPVGIWATFGVWLAIMAVAFVAVWRTIERAEPPAKPASKRASRRRAAAGRSDAILASRFLASWLIAGALLLPLTFSIAFVDVFALPKTIVLRLVAIGTAVGLVVAVANHGRILGIRAVDLGLAALLIIGGIATMLSPAPAVSLYGLEFQHQGLLAFAAYAVLFVGARFAIVDVVRVRLLAVAVVVAASVAAMYAVVQWVGLDPIWDTLFKDRVFSTVGQANALGSTLAMALGLSIALVPESGRRSRWALLGADALIGFGFLLTLSRGGYLGVAAAAVVAGLILIPLRSGLSVRAQVPKALGFAGAIVVAVALLAVAWRPAGQFIGQVASRAGSIANPAESSNVSHLDLWAVGVRIAADHPLIGTGLETYSAEFPEYRDRVLRPERAAVMARFAPESPHNVYLAIAGGAGVLALAAYLIVIGGTLLSAARASVRQLPVVERIALAALAAAATVHLVTDSFMTGEPGSSATFWIILGAAAGLASRLRARPGTEAAVPAAP